MEISNLYMFLLSLRHRVLKSYCKTQKVLVLEIVVLVSKEYVAEFMLAGHYT
jgi:hypothetical protein